MLPLFVSAETHLNVQYSFQIESNWCWATAGEVVSTYYTVPQAQSDFAFKAFNGKPLNLINYLYTGYNSTDYPIQADDEVLYPLGLNQLLHQKKIYTQNYYRKLTIGELSREITELHPVVLFWTTDNGNGHVVVATGIGKDSIVEILNPAYGEGFVSMPYSILRGDPAYGGRRWTSTLITSADSFPTKMKKYPEPDSLILWLVDPEYRRKHPGKLSALEQIKRFVLNLLP